MLDTSIHARSPMGRMRPNANRSLRIAGACLCVVACLLAGAAFAEPFEADPVEVGETNSFAATFSPLAPNPYLPSQFTGRHLQLSGQRAGDTSNGSLQVFQLSLRALLPDDRRDWWSFLQPFLLAGKADLQEPDGRNYGLQIPGGRRITALHIGGGAAVILDDHWRVTATVGESIHSGGSRLPNDSQYRLSFGYDF